METLKKIIKAMLEPYIEEEVSGEMCYYKDEGGDELIEYDSCTDDECVRITLENIHSQGLQNIETVYIHNNCDHENIERCHVCGCALNEHLTWIEYEFDHHIEYTKSFDDIKQSAFDLRVMIESHPGIGFKKEKEFSEYMNHLYMVLSINH